MQEDSLVDRLDTAAQNPKGELRDLLTAARKRIRDHQEQIASLQTELEETNEGMVALTVELQEAEQRFRSLFEDAAEGIYKTTEDVQYYEMVNQSMADVLGYDDPSQLEETVRIEDIFVDRNRFSEYRSALRNNEELENFEYRIHRKDGEQRWVSDSVRLVSEGNGKNSYRGGVIDITERKEYESRLQERNEALETLNRVVRHDIRNDIQVISTWAETLSASVDAENRDGIERIRQKADSITTITEEAATVIETLTGESETELEPISLGSALVEEVERQRDAYPDAEFQLPASIPFVQVWANDMLGSVFRNVLTNAVTHNDADRPVIEIDCDRRGDDVAVRIADNGPGISDDNKEAIFGKGVQSMDSDGTGIGLYLVNYLIGEYGGDVWVEDNDPSGAVFVILLPIAE